MIAPRNFSTYHTNLERESTGEMVPVEIHFTYYAGCRGHRDKWGAPTTPDDPEEMEILQVLGYTSRKNLTHLLTKDELSRLEGEVLDYVHQCQREINEP